MSKTIRVEVTAEDIANGVPFDSRACPVSLAITRAMKSPKPIKIERTYLPEKGYFVGVATLPLKIGPRAIAFRLSRRVGQFTLRFDDASVGLGPVPKPFAFRVWR